MRPRPRRVSCSSMQPSAALRNRALSSRPARLAAFYADVFELEPRNAPGDGSAYLLGDGRVTLMILPWKISDFDGSGIAQPALDHIGFTVPDLDAFRKEAEETARLNPHIAPRPIDINAEGAARLALFRKCPRGAFHMADPDGNLIDVAARA